MVHLQILTHHGNDESNKSFKLIATKSVSDSSYLTKVDYIKPLNFDFFISCYTLDFI